LTLIIINLILCRSSVTVLHHFEGPQVFFVRLVETVGYHVALKVLTVRFEFHTVVGQGAELTQNIAAGVRDFN